MLALPVIQNGVHSPARFISTLCDQNRWQETCNVNSSRSFEAADNGKKGPIMLRVKTQESEGSLICTLEGRFTGEEAEHVRLLVTRCNSKLELIVDLTDVMFMDAVGEDVLSLIKRLGGKFAAETSYARDICERLQLPLACNHDQNSELSGNGDGNGHRSLKNSRCR
jgi:hypothetical protein